MPDSLLEECLRIPPPDYEKTRSGLHYQSMMGDRLSGESSEFLTDLGFRIVCIRTGFQPLSNHDLHSPILTPAFFGVICRERFSVGVPDRLDSIGIKPSVDQCLACMFRPCPGKFDIIPKAFPGIVPEWGVVGMPGNLYALVTESV
jgi:hypothetical protein